MRVLSVALLAMLLAPALAGPVQANAPEWSVISIERAGNDVTFRLRANSDMRNVSVALVQGETVVGLPEQEHASWPSGETRTATYTLLKNVDSATLRFRFLFPSGFVATRTVDVYIPARVDSGSSQGSGARVLVMDAVLDKTDLSVELSNVGDASTGLLLVSVEDAQQRKIATPYYRSISSMKASTASAVSFTVAADTRDVVLALEYQNKTERTPFRVRLAEGGAGGGASAGAANVSLSTDLPFREVDIGRSVDYAITVKNTGGLALVQLEADGLPAGYSARFFVGGSAVPSLYLDRNQTRQLTLSLTVPNSDEEVDRTIEFDVVARSNGTELARQPMGLAVRGIGKLVLIALDDPGTIPPGGQARSKVTVRNSGSAPLFDIEMDSRRAYGWTVRFEPARIDRLDPGESRDVTVEVRAPDVISSGNYATDVSARAGDQSAPWSTLSVDVESDKEGSGGWLWLLFGGLMVGTLGFAAWKKKQG